MNEYLEFAKDIAYKAGEIMRKYFKEENYSTYKSDDTIVTKADTEINHYLIKKVKEIFPTHSVIGEEENMEKASINGYVIPLMEQLCMQDIFQ